MDVLCLKAHSLVYCWHVLTCFLSVCASIVHLSYHQLRKGGLMGDMCPVVSLPNRWEIIEVIQSVLCVCEQERKKERKKEWEGGREMLPSASESMVPESPVMDVSQCHCHGEALWYPGSVYLVIGWVAGAAVFRFFLLCLLSDPCIAILFFISSDLIR